MRKNIIVVVITLVMFTSCIGFETSAIDFSGETNLKQATLLMEAETGQVLREENGYERLPAGTMNKVMAILLVAEAIDSGELSMDTMITTSAHANSMNGSVIWLMTGEQMSVRDLLKGVIIGNANDATVALAEAICGGEEEFVALMNKRADELGMTDTVFTDSTGLDDEGQYSSAYNLALLGREIVKHRFLYEDMACWRDFIRGEATELVNENTLVRECPSLTGIKAGHSPNSGNTLLISAERDGVSYIAVVLGCSDKKQRFSIGRNLINVGFENFTVTNPSFSNELLMPVTVKGGIEGAVEIEAKKLTSLIIPNETGDDITSVVFLPKYINAPIRKGQPIGTVAFYRGDVMIYETQLVTTNEVEEMSVRIAFSRLLSSMFK